MRTTGHAAGANFASDNVAGASPEIVAALAACAEGSARPYGADELTQRVERRLAELFEREVGVFLVATGSAANSLALGALTPPWGSVLCHAESHIHNDECGAPEFYTGGAKLVPLGGAAARIDAPALREAAVRKAGDVHAVQPACVSITQATEEGSVYGLDAIGEIGAVCRDAGLRLHMDGARFANALVSLGCTPAEMTWKAGVDALSFGATKNGVLAAEAVLLFDPALAANFGFRRKRGGHLLSKMRLLAAQMDAYLEGDLWLRNARHANAMARRLADGLAAIEGVALQGPVEANLFFCRLPVPVLEGLLAEGHVFYHERWGPGVVRLVTSFATRADEVDGFVASARRLAAAA